MMPSFIGLVKSLSVDVLKGLVSPFAAVRFILLYSFGFPDFLLRGPRVLWRVFQALLFPNSDNVYAFTSFDLWLRSYYNKLARNFRQVGRFGYVWEDSLGFPMGGRFGSNTISYAVYGTLSPQIFSLLCYLVFHISIIAISVYTGHIWQGFAITLLLAVSPAIIMSLVAYYVKPEMMWWSLSAPLFTFALNGQWTAAFIILNIYLFSNTTVSVVSGFVFACIWIYSIIEGSFTLGLHLFWLVPGLTVRVVRLIYAYLDGNLMATTREQNIVQKRGNDNQYDKNFALRSSPAKLIPLLWETILPLSIASWPHWRLGLVTSIAIVVLFAINWIVIKVGDNVTMRVVSICAAIALALYGGTWISLLGVYAIVFFEPFNTMWYVNGKLRYGRLVKQAEKNNHPISKRIRTYMDFLDDYPWITPMSYPQPTALMQLFQKIPDNSRLLMEGDGEPRVEGRFSRFRDWTNEFLPERQVEFVNHTFMNRMLEPMLADRYLNHFGAPHLDASQMHDLCCTLGVSYVIAFTDETRRALEDVNYQPVVTVPYDDFADMADLLFMPESNLTLYANSEQIGVLDPHVGWTRHRNEITWNAQAGVRYTLRYRFHPAFEAYQGDQHLAIEPYYPIEDLSLCFMRVTTGASGQVTVKFQPRKF